MTVYSIRYYASNWHHALPSGEEAQTLPQLATDDRAIATRLDVPGEQYWDGSEWSRKKPARLAEIERSRTVAHRAEKTNAEWLDTHSAELTKRAKGLGPDPMDSISPTDVIHPSSRLREWAERSVAALGGHPNAADRLIAEPKRWLAI